MGIGSTGYTWSDRVPHKGSNTVAKWLGGNSRRGSQGKFELNLAGARRFWRIVFLLLELPNEPISSNRFFNQNFILFTIFIVWLFNFSWNILFKNTSRRYVIAFISLLKKTHRSFSIFLCFYFFILRKKAVVFWPFSPPPLFLSTMTEKNVNQCFKLFSHDGLHENNSDRWDENPKILTKSSQTLSKSKKESKKRTRLFVHSVTKNALLLRYPYIR